MCILAILYKTAKNAPLLVVANREEELDRPTQAPKIQSGTPRVICGIDRQAGGTWLGVNQYGLFATVANRPKAAVPSEPRSRGLLCRELLEKRTAEEAARHAVEELQTGRYAGANFVVADADFAAVVQWTDRVSVLELEPGLHVLSNGEVDDLNDPRQEFVRRMLTLHTLDSAVTFLAVASRAFSRKPDAGGRRGVIVLGEKYGTVSSTLLSLPGRLQQSVFQYAPGPPCDVSHDDLSALLRQVLSADKNRTNREPGNSGNSAKSKSKSKPKTKAKAKSRR